MKKKALLLLLLGIFYATTFAQSDQQPETDPIITNRISQWQDLKFGFMMHWGIYAQWEVVESWSICNEPWINRDGADYYKYKIDYQNLNKTFNPKSFDPSKWAEAAKNAGMKYVVFTTKHHDGFCLFDTKETSYSTVDPSCPFSKNPKADITGEVVKAFREKGFWTGLYFSKPDWHCDDYWAHEWATPDRNVNYDPTAMPERFEKYKQFTHRQIRELTHNYGDIDILWLDGGWVRPEWSVNDETRPWLGCQGYIQDIDMPTVAKIARENNPDLIIVDRSVGGKYENYQTPRATSARLPPSLSLGDLHVDGQLVVVCLDRHLQKHQQTHPPALRYCGQGRQLPPQRWPRCQWQPARHSPAPHEGNRRMDASERRGHLRHTPHLSLLLRQVPLHSERRQSLWHLPLG